jgi:hypothetical protein
MPLFRSKMKEEGLRVFAEENNVFGPSNGKKEAV